MHRIDYIIYRTECTLCTGLTVHYLQDWVYFMYWTECTLCTWLTVHYLQDWVYFMHRTDCTLFTGLSVLYAQDWLYIIYRTECTLCTGLSVLYVLTDCTLFTGLSVLYAQDWLYIIYRTECALYTRQCSLCTWASVELRMRITQGLPSLVHIGLVISEEKIVMWIQVTRWQMTDYVRFLIAKGHLEFSQVNWVFLWKHAVVCSPLLMCNTTNMIKTFGILVIWIPKKIKEIKNKIGAHQ